MRVADGIDEAVKPKLRGVSHQFAFFVALAGGVVLLVVAPVARAAWAGLVYALSLAGMYGISATYHRRNWSLRARRLMRRLDHAAIFLLIAGTYTPVCLLGLPGTRGLVLLGIVWAGAVLGVLHTVFFVNSFRAFNAVLYVVLGCAIVPLVPTLGVALGPVRAALLLAGGVFYIGGAVVYARRWPNPSPAVFGYHEVFHVMVIIAGALHFAAVLSLVGSAQRV
jgi:hemolysin III